MSSGKIYLTRDQQIFLMEMLEVNTPEAAVDKFANIMAEERADPTELQKYIKKIMKAMNL